jgi:hypothetical protein
MWNVPICICVAITCTFVSIAAVNFEVAYNLRRTWWCLVMEMKRSQSQHDYLSNGYLAKQCNLWNYFHWVKTATHPSPESRLKFNELFLFSSVTEDNKYFAQPYRNVCFVVIHLIWQGVFLSLKYLPDCTGNTQNRREPRSAHKTNFRKPLDSGLQRGRVIDVLFMQVYFA